MDYFKEGWTRWCLVTATAGIGLFFLKRRTRGVMCPSTAQMHGKTVVITGANCGLGKATALELAKRKARVIMACRDTNAGDAAARDIRRQTGDGELVVAELDLASLSSTKDFCDHLCANESAIDVLINNAGVYGCPFQHTEEGFEMQMGVNHLGAFYLTNQLMEKLRASAHSRIVIVGSGLAKRGSIDFGNINSEKGYDKNAGYYNSKLANYLFGRELAKREHENMVCVNCVRPGMVWTNLGRHVPFPKWLKIVIAPLAWLLIRTPYEGCQSIVYCAVAEELEGCSGNLYYNCREVPWPEKALDDNTAEKLWTVSEQMTRLSS